MLCMGTARQSAKIEGKTVFGVFLRFFVFNNSTYKFFKLFSFHSAKKIISLALMSNV